MPPGCSTDIIKATDPRQSWKLKGNSISHYPVTAMYGQSVHWSSQITSDSLYVQSTTEEGKATKKLLLFGSEEISCVAVWEISQQDVILFAFCVLSK